MTFAGFWVDGAVRRPEQRHFDGDELIHAKWKKEYPDFDLVTAQFAYFNEVYWLDTTPRESLTPEELFSLIKAIWPSVENVHKHNEASWYVDDVESGTKVDWGNLTQYPPPVEPQWIRVTRNNVRQYLFRECRFSDRSDDGWLSGHVAGWCQTEDCCLVHSQCNDEMPVMTWNYVEVQS